MKSVALEIYLDKLPCACSMGKMHPKAAAFSSLVVEMKRDRGRDFVFSVFSLNLHFQRFKENPELRRILQDEGHGALPVTCINGEPVFKGRFPDRAELEQALDKALKRCPEEAEM